MGLAAPSRSILQSEVAFGPAFPPETDGVGMQLHADRRRGIREEWMLMQQEDQAGSLSELEPDRASCAQRPGLEPGNPAESQGGRMAEDQAWHASSCRSDRDVHSRSSKLTQASRETLQLFLKRTTKLHGVVAYGARIRGESSVGSGSDQGGSSAAVGVDREETRGRSPGPVRARTVKRRPKPHPLLRMPRKRAKRLIKRGIIPYNKA